MQVHLAHHLHCIRAQARKHGTHHLHALKLQENAVNKLNNPLFNHYKRANEARLELIIPFQIDVMRGQQNRITNSEVYSTIPAIMPLRLTLLCPKGYLCLLHLLDYISHVLLLFGCISPNISTTVQTFYP